MPYKRLISNLLHVNNLRKFLGSASVSLAVKSKFKLEILESAPRGKVLVLAPHPDDDVFGCGGTLALHQKNGDQIKVLYLTSTPKRKKEAEDATRVLNISDIELWGLKEGKFSANKRTSQKLTNLINDFAPSIIYCPSFSDPHPDHFETSAMLFLSLQNLPSKTLSSIHILLYEIWTPIYANRLIKIDSVMNTKKAAISCHKSQIGQRGYFDAIIGLNAYRAGMFSVGHFAEAFTALNPELYIKLFRIYNLND